MGDTNKAMRPRVYHYHPVTGEFLGDEEADESPLEPGVHLLPAHATFKRPPSLLEDSIVIPDGKRLVYSNDEWRLEDIPKVDDTVKPNDGQTSDLVRLDEEYTKRLDTAALDFVKALIKNDETLIETAKKAYIDIESEYASKRSAIIIQLAIRYDGGVSG